MSYNPYARYTYGGSLYHGRKAIADGGARNGYSNTPGYRPTGKKAVGRIVGYDRSGHPIYAYTNAGPTPWSVSQQRRNAQIARGSDARDVALRNLNQKQENRRLAADAEARRNKRIGEAVATRSGQRGRDEREAQQRKGDRIIANERGNTLRNKVGKAQLNVSANVNRAKNNAGNWLDTTRRNVGNWFDRRGDEVRNFANRAIDAVSNRDERAAMERAREAYRTNPTEANKKAYRNAVNAYQNHGLTRAERFVNDRRNDIGLAARNVARNVRNFNAGKLVNNAIDAVSNRDERAAMERAREAYRTNPTEANKKAYRNAVNAYQNHGLTRAERKVKDIGDNVGLTARNASRNVRNTVNRTTRDAGEFVRNTVGNASQKIRSVGEYAKLRAKEIRSTISNLPSNVKKQADQIIGDIRSGKTVSEIKAKEIELTNLINNAVGGGFTMPSDSYLNKIDPKKKK